MKTPELPVAPNGAALLSKSVGDVLPRVMVAVEPALFVVTGVITPPMVTVPLVTTNTALLAVAAGRLLRMVTLPETFNVDNVDVKVVVAAVVGVTTVPIAMDPALMVPSPVIMEAAVLLAMLFCVNAPEILSVMPVLTDNVDPLAEKLTVEETIRLSSTATPPM